MSARGVHFAITTVETRPLLDAEDDDALVEAVEAIEERWDTAHLCETDKAWDAIHRTLTDGTLLTEAGGETDPLSLAVFGGRTLNEGDEHWVVLVDAKDVRRVATALGKMRQADFRARYFGKKFPDYDGEQGEEDFAYTWSNFQDLAKFYAKAAKDRRHVVFSVSQLPGGDATAPWEVGQRRADAAAEGDADGADADADAGTIVGPNVFLTYARTATVSASVSSARCAGITPIVPFLPSRMDASSSASGRVSGPSGAVKLAPVFAPLPPPSAPWHAMQVRRYADSPGSPGAAAASSAEPIGH